MDFSKINFAGAGLAGSYDQLINLREVAAAAQKHDNYMYQDDGGKPSISTPSKMDDGPDFPFYKNGGFGSDADSLLNSSREHPFSSSLQNPLANSGKSIFEDNPFRQFN